VNPVTIDSGSFVAVISLVLMKGALEG
jgi:hypothetical protein